MVVMTIPQSTMMMGRKMLGFNRLSRTFVKGSANAYEMKKIVSEALYCPFVILRSVCRPSIFALPIFVRSKNLKPDILANQHHSPRVNG